MVWVDGLLKTDVPWWYRQNEEELESDVDYTVATKGLLKI